MTGSPKTVWLSARRRVAALVAALVAAVAVLAGALVTSLPEIVLTAAPASAAVQSQSFANSCAAAGSSNPTWRQSNDDILCTLVNQFTCPADSSGCRVDVTNFQLLATADNRALDVTVHGWLAVTSGQQVLGRLECNSRQSTSSAECDGHASQTVLAGTSVSVYIGGSFALSGVGTPRTGAIRTRGSVRVSYEANPCGVEPCFLEIFVNGDHPAPGGEQGANNRGWGVGIVTMEPTSGQQPVGPFAEGSWAAQFNQKAGCWDGDQAVGLCHEAGVFSRPVTVTLTAHVVPEGGFSAHPQPNDQSPSWASEFVKWGGDCASAGTGDTCTLRVGTQVSTVSGDRGSYSLSVTANFAVKSDSSSGSGF